MKNKELSRQVDALEGERLRLLQQLRENAGCIGSRGAVQVNGLSDPQLLKLSEFAANLKKGFVELPLDDRSKELHVSRVYNELTSMH
jgi:hypothetical protein